MLTEANFKDYVGFQESKANPAMAFMLRVEYTTGIRDSEIQSSTNDRLIDRLVQEEVAPMRLPNMNINKTVVTCDLSLDEMLSKVNELFLSFPYFPKTSPHYLNQAKNQIARQTLRACGNKEIDDIVLYKGPSEFDAALVVVKVDDLYGIVTQENFTDYGFRL